MTTAPTELERPDVDESVGTDVPWITLVWNDPVNLMSYVTYVFMTYFHYPREKAEKLMMDVHTQGRAVVANGTREAMEAGLPFEAVQTEHRGSLSRRVQCVHCKGITENVKTDPFQCSHCGLHLFVRDHYSRRLAAFQGVNIDAEDKGQIPPAVERFK